MNPLDLARLLSDERAIRGTVEDMLKEKLPGSERKTREELEAIVRQVHEAAKARHLRGELTPHTAARWEWLEIMKILRT